MKYNVESINERIKALPMEKDIFNLEKGLDIVIHEFLDEVNDHKGTICDEKDLEKHTIYRIHFTGKAYQVEVITANPKSMMLDHQMDTVKEAIDFVINTIN